MMVAEIKIKIACCYEVAAELADVVCSDEFAHGVKSLIGKIVDTGEDAKLNQNDLCIEVVNGSEQDKVLKVLYADGEDAKREKASE